MLTYARALSGQVRLNQSFISRAGGVGAAAVAREREISRGTAGPAGTVHEEIATGGKTRLGEKSLYESRDSYRDSLLAPGRGFAGLEGVSTPGRDMNMNGGGRDARERQDGAGVGLLYASDY